MPVDYGRCEGCTEPTEDIHLYAVRTKQDTTFQAWYCLDCAENAVGEGNGQGGFLSIRLANLGHPHP